MVVISAAFAVSSRKKNFIAVLVIALPCLAFAWFEWSIFQEEITIIELLLKIIFNGFMMVIILKHIFQTENISHNTVSAALIAYLLLALLWSDLYLILELLYPGSFSVSHETLKADASIFRYFSFVTITTLGFGDVAPVSTQARSLTTLEAFMGQIYMAVLVARLVGIQTAQFFEKKKK